MRGFFTLENAKQGPQKTAKKRSGGCQYGCILNKECKSPMLPPSGGGKRGILIISQAPGAEEDKNGWSLVGPRGETLNNPLMTYLRRELKKVGIDMERDCIKTDAVACRTPGDRIPTGKEIDICSDRVWKVISETKPKVILLLGGSALDSFLGGRWKKDLGAIGKWRGLKIWDRDAACWVVATFHPNYILRNQDRRDDISEKFFQRDLLLMQELIDEPVPAKDSERELIQIVENDSQVIKMLQRIRAMKKPIAFDYETSGIRPYKAGHFIYSCSIAWGRDECMAFLVNDRVVGELKKLLCDPDVGKIASNMKFEHLWSKIILGIDVQGWWFDTMLASHILDNRTGISGLKFQAYIRCGIIDYASHLDKYIMSRDGSEFNVIREAPVKEMLLYNGLDSLLEYRIAMDQEDEINETK